MEFDPSGKMVYSSPQVENVTGFSPEEMLAKQVDFHPDDLPLVAESVQRLRSGETTGLSRFAGFSRQGVRSGH